MADTTNISIATSSDTVSVMIGSLFNFTDLLIPAIADPLIASGGVGLDGMGYVITSLTLQKTGDVPKFAQLWSGTGSGTQEETDTFGSAEGNVTLQNTTASTIYIKVEGTTFSTAAGLGFQAVSDVHVGNWSLGSGTTGLGSYSVAPGQSITIPVQALQYGASTAANTITTSSIPGLVVTASDAMTAPTTWTNPAQNNQGGFMTTAFAQYTTIYTGQGLAPAESQVNVDGSHEWTSHDLAAWGGYVDNCRSVGILNVAPIMGDNSDTADLTQPFATSSWYANLRAAALYSGGLAFDLPPDYWLGRTFDDYQQNIIEQIRWCNQMGLRSDLIIGSSPQNGQPDPNYLSHTLELLNALKAAGALPSQVVVENYVAPEQPNFYDANTADVNSMNAVALAVSDYGTGAPTPSEAGLEVKGTSAAQTTLIMTGVQPSEDYTPASTFLPYQVTQIHEVDPTRQLTLTVTDNAKLLALRDTLTGQSVGAGGSLTFTGTSAQATSFLNDLIASAANGATGTAQLELQLTDYKGETTAGLTSVSVGHVHPLFTSITETPSVAGTLHVGATVTYAIALSEGVTVQGAPTLLLSNMRTATYVGMNAAGNLLFTYQVAPGDDIHYLRVRALQPNSAVITDASGLAINPDQLDAVQGMTNAFSVDTQNAQVTSVTETGSSAVLGAGSSITFSIGSNLPLLVPAGGAPTLTLSDGGLATYIGLTATGAMLFNYDVPTGGYATALAPTALNLNGAAITNSAGEPLIAPYTMPTPTGGGLAYDARATTPLDTVTFYISEQAYQGDAIALFSINGQQVGGPVTITAPVTSGQPMLVTMFGNFGGGGVQSASVTFQNSLTGATAGQRALFVSGMSFNGQFENQPAILTGSQPYTVPIVSSPDDLLQIWVSEDAYLGNAQFIVTVDGKQVGGTYAATTLHSSGQWQEVDIDGQFGTGAHSVNVMFTNDANGGSSTLDRNLYVQKIALDGTTVTTNAAILSTYGSTTANFAAPSDTLTVDVSENAWAGDAQFYVTVDGKQIGGLQTVTALHATGANQAVTLQGSFGSGSHTVGLSFINPASGGTSNSTRALFVSGASYDGQKIAVQGTLTNLTPFSFQAGTSSTAISSIVTAAQATAAGTFMSSTPITQIATSLSAIPPLSGSSHLSTAPSSSSIVTYPVQTTHTTS